MKRLVVAIFIVLCFGICSAAEIPTVNLPLSLRQENWVSNRGSGSCVWATTISLLRWQGEYASADWMRKNCSGGAGPSDAERIGEHMGLRYACTHTPDIHFLEWACATRRGCGISIPGRENHFVTLVYLDSKWAGILDNNSVREYIWIPREELLRKWREMDGWAFAIVHSPAAPLPK